VTLADEMKVHVTKTQCKERLGVYDETGKRVGFVHCKKLVGHKGPHEYEKGVTVVSKARMKELGLCTQPDRHEPKLVCGYPLPCPHHTIVVEEEKALELLEQLDQVDGDPDGAGELDPGLDEVE